LIGAAARGKRTVEEDPRMAIPFTPLVAALPATVPFVGPETLERQRGRPFRARLGANESAFGPAPAAVAAMARAAAETWAYGDPEAHALREALGDDLGVDRSQIVIGEGVDGLLGVASRLFLGPGDVAVATLGSYPTFAFHVAGVGARIAAVPYRDDAPDLDGLAEAAGREGARVVYLANPDNPSAAFHGPESVARLLATLPQGCMLMLDEAYAEFAPPGALPRIDPHDARVIRLRTFSKAHGLAGLRVGFAFGAREVVAAFDKLRNHFGVGRVAQAGALAALAARDWLGDVTARTLAARARLMRIAEANGLRPLPSATNFATIDCGADGAFARRVLAETLARDAFIRMPGAAPLDRCIRVTAGPDAHLDVFEEALPAALAAARAG
jgi:histidinol-phosphate aminotransferase